VGIGGTGVEVPDMNSEELEKAPTAVPFPAHQDRKTQLRTFLLRR